MSEGIKRVYIYQETKDKIQKWAKDEMYRSPNNKDNFPYTLKRYIEHLEWKGK